MKECCNLSDRACEALQQAQQRIVLLLCEELQVKLAALYVSNQQRDEAIRERDQARWEVCTHEADTAEDQRKYAAQRGWDRLHAPPPNAGS